MMKYIISQSAFTAMTDLGVSRIIFVTFYFGEVIRLLNPYTTVNIDRLGQLFPFVCKLSFVGNKARQKHRFISYIYLGNSGWNNVGCSSWIFRTEMQRIHATFNQVVNRFSKCRFLYET